MKLNRKLVAVLLLIVLTVPLVAHYIRMSIFYMVATQGIQPDLNSIQFKGYWYDHYNKGPNENYIDPYTSKPAVASALNLHDRVNFDADYDGHALPNIQVSMVPITVDRDVSPLTYGPWRIKIGETQVTAENGTERTLEVYKEFEVKRFKCDWAMNIWLTGKDAEITPDKESSSYYDVNIWIKLIPQRFGYFVDNPDQVYFAPCLVQLSQNAEWVITDENGMPKEYPGIGGVQDLTPEAAGETMGIFYARGGADVDLDESKVLSYQGAMLDPAIFRDEYWVYLSLNTFKPQSYWDPWGLKNVIRLPSVQLNFLVYVFVVGEWTVKMYSDEIVALEPHQTEWRRGSMEWFLIGLGEWWENPFNKLLVFGTLFIILIVVLAVTGVLPVLFGVAKSASARRKKK